MNSLPLAGATGSSLGFNPIDRTNSGTYYLVVTNNSGSITSLVTRVAAFGAPVNSWLNTNALPSGTSIADLQSDGSLGVVLLGNNGISRLDDDGVLRWTIPFAPASNLVTGGFGRLACAVDGLGNTFVTCPFTGVVNLGSLSVTNPGVITVSNPNARGAFLAKLDITGQTVWMRYLDGGLDFTKLTVDGGGGAVITGAHNSVVNFGNGGSQATPNANGGALARYNPDGTLAWIRNYASTTGGLVEIDAVVAQGTNIWVGGIFNFNVKFGTFTATDNSVGHAYNSWFGALNTNGTELWLQSIILGSQFMHLGAGLDQSLWAANGSSSDFIVRIAPNGTFNGGGTPFSPTVASVGCINIDSNNVAVMSGVFSSSVTVGTNTFTRPNTFTNFAYSGRFDTNGAGLGAVADGFSTTGSAFQLFAGNRRGDAYVAGAEPVRFGTNSIAGTNFYLAKLNAPALAPAIITQPNAGTTNLPFNRFDLNVTALGQSPLSYQWRNNGVPIPNQTNAALTFVSPLPPDGGSLDCVVSNAWGVVTSSVSQVVFLPPFNLVQQPASREIILGTNEISGSNVLTSFLQPAAMVGHQFNFFITNGIGMWPPTGNFAMTLPTASTFSIPTGTLGTHAGNLSNPFTFSQGIGFSLLYWTSSPSNIMSSIVMSTDGSFNIHHDITDPAGCCASGYYTISGGSSNATFQLTLSGSVLPAIQWFRNGVALAGQTNSTLSYVLAGYPQVGTYTASLTYSNYVTTTAPATLSIYPPALGYTFVPGNSAMSFTIPPGYALQSTVTLTPANWSTISVSATYNVQLNQPGAYYRIVPQ